MNFHTRMLITLLLLAIVADSFALGYDLRKVEHDWAIDGPGGRYGIMQFAPYSPPVRRRTLVMFAGRSQEIPIAAPWAAALPGIFAVAVGFGVLFCRRRASVMRKRCSVRSRRRSARWHSPAGFFGH